MTEHGRSCVSWPGGDGSSHRPAPLSQHSPHRNSHLPTLRPPITAGNNAPLSSGDWRVCGSTPHANSGVPATQLSPGETPDASAAQLTLGRRLYWTRHPGRHGSRLSRVPAAAPLYTTQSQSLPQHALLKKVFGQGHARRCAMLLAGFPSTVD